MTIFGHGTRESITLADATDSYNFHIGDTVVLTEMGPRRIRGWFGFKYKSRLFAIRMTRWFRPRIVTSAVDVEQGTITMVQERWSWRRWRWER